MDIDAFNDLIEFARKREESAATRYDSFAKRSQNPLVVDFFSKLAIEEKRHAKRLGSISAWHVRSYNKDIIDKLSSSDLLVELDYNDNMNFQDALLFAIKDEKRSITFYRKLCNAASDMEIKGLFNLLMEEEMEHKKSLEELYEDTSLQFF